MRRLERDRSRRERGWTSYFDEAQEDIGELTRSANLSDQFAVGGGPEEGPAVGPPPRKRASRKVTVREPRRRGSLRVASPRTHLHLAAHFGLNYVKKYYMDTYLGLLWIPLVPVLDVLMRALFFGGFLGMSSGDRPYLIFLLVGSIGWYFFDRTALWSYRSLQYNRREFRSVPIPWLPAVTGSVVPGALQAGLYGLIALVVSGYYKLTDGSFYLSFGGGTGFALLGLFLLLLYAWTLGLLLAPLVRVVRDVRFVIRYVFTFWYMMTPILYSIQSIPERYQSIAVYNPLTAPIEFIRHGFFQSRLPSERSIVTCLVVLGVVVPFALILFARAERSAHARL